ncbi:uncharacterized protein LY89DRAFT_731498 [Mollisia scopiformis]|uniref:Uncharacterized protein n=1 Tax=Mollisia scopiformis TaxID=149040 RepID=A0A194XG07_MOLSC|nr:uncharacterized protein LY89DRAFT_731498 [Mollisia scopiformis]KUJ19076.1 hypothetical protein LY89DRAFT_731498 [Mollisia scopiformis]
MVKARPHQHELLDEDEDEELNDENSIIVDVPPPRSKSRKRTVSDLSGEVKVKTPSPKKRKVLPVRGKDGDEEKLPSTRPVVEIPARTMSPPRATTGTIEGHESGRKTNHRRFDSEEPVEEVFSTTREPAGNAEDSQSEEHEDEDSDDDAPEAVGMQEAAQTIRAREKDAAKAVKEQAAASRQKRKEREETLRKQAESTKKRKPKTEVERLEDRVIITIESDDDEDEKVRADIEAIDDEDDVAPPTRISRHRDVPDLLPLEFLEDDDPNEVIAAEEAPRIAPRKKKFKELLEKGPKDRRVGKTTYRVTKTQSTNLAPKAAHNARSVKESWLQGRSGMKIDSNRKPFSKGFFKK